MIFNFKLNICYPHEIKISRDLKKKVKEHEENTELSHSVIKAVKDSDCLITDTWFSMGKKPSSKLLKVFKPYQVNKKVMSYAKPDSIFMHCLPAKIGSEVSNDVIKGSKSIVLKQAKNTKVQYTRCLMEVYIQGRHILKHRNL